MDPLVQQTSTGRKISFTFKILNASVNEARYNAVSINMLLQMMYPRLQSNGNIEAGSFFRIHGVPYLKEEATKNYQTCLISNISYDLNVDEGFITPQAYELYPKSISINIEGQAIIPPNRTPSPPEELPEGIEDGESWAAGQMEGWLAGGEFNSPYPATYPSYIHEADPESDRFLESRATGDEPDRSQESDPATREQADTETISEED
jgi:predicted DNA-binding ribbon-helix-helix protein